jgi:hypothetical protein
MRGFCKLVNSQMGVEIAPRIIQSALDAVRLWLEFKQCGMLCLATGTSMVHNQVSCHRSSQFLSCILLHHSKR